MKEKFKSKNKMSLLQNIKNLTSQTALAFLLVVLLSTHSQVFAETTNMRDMAQALWKQGKEILDATPSEENLQVAVERLTLSLNIYMGIGDRQSEADILTCMAEVSWIKGNLVDAINYLKESQKIYDKLGSSPGLMAAFEDVDKAIKLLSLESQISRAIETEDYELAFKIYDDALRLVREMGGRMYEASILSDIGRLQKDLRNYSDAKHYLEKALIIYSEPGDSSYKGQLLVEIAVMYCNEPEVAKEGLSKSLEYLNDALRIFESLNDKVNMEDTLYWTGCVYYELKNYTEAQTYFKKALEISQDIGDREIEVSNTRKLGIIFKELGYYNKPLKYFEQMLNAIKETESHPEKGDILNTIGDLHYGMGNYEEAMKAYDEAMQIFKERNDKPNQGYVLFSMGNANRNLGNYLEAIDNLEGAFEIFSELEDLFRQKHALLSLGEVYSELGDYEKSKEYDLKSKKIFIPPSEETKDSQFLSLFNLGVHKLIVEKKYDKALDFYIQALDLSRELENKNDEMMSLVGVGDAYLELMEYSKALDFYRQGLLIAKQIGYLLFEDRCYRFIGKVFERQGQFEKAAESYEKALIVSRKLGRSINIWNNQFDLGHLADITGQLQKAKSYYSEAINTIESTRENILGEEYKTSYIEDKIFVYDLMINLLLDLGEDEEAFNYLERAKSRSLLDLLGNKIKLEKGKDKEQSQEERRLQRKINEFLVKIQKEQSQLNGKQSKTLNVLNEELEKTRKKYSELLLKVKRNNPELCSLVSVNPLTLREIQELIEPDTTLLEYYVPKHGIFPEQEAVTIWVINKNEFKVVGGRISGLASRLSNKNEYKEADGRISELASIVAAFREKIAGLQPDYERIAEILYDLLIRTAKPYIKTKRICIVPVLELHYLPYQALLNVPVYGGLGMKVDLSNGKLIVGRIVEGSPAYKAGLKSGDRILAIDGDSSINMSPYPYEAVNRLNGKPSTSVLLTVETGESGKKKTIKLIRESIVKLSFQAKLPDNKVDVKKDNVRNQSRFLIEEYDIFYAPSASVLRFVLEKRKEISDKVLAFGNPELGDESLSLPHAEEEIERIKENYPKTALYLNENATEEKAKRLSGNYDIIHFASHGELNSKSPLFSCIKMAKEKGEDGRLEVHEIFNLNLENTSLVTLSACETGLGKLTSGDELIGLTRGFIYAGTPSIVASLWKVNDQSTSELMNLFYKNLKTHSKVEALRMAQLEMINGEVGRGIVRGVGGITTSEEGKDKHQSSRTVNRSHPYFWAPFILLGDWK